MSRYADFERQGYLIAYEALPKNLVEEVGGFLREAMDQAAAFLCDRLETGLADLPQAIDRRFQAGRLDGLDKAVRDAMTGHFPLEVRLSEELWRIPRHPAFRDMVSELLGGGKIYMHMPPAARWVLPGNIHSGVPTHQDVSYNRHMTDFLTVWTPFVDIDDACGGVGVYPETAHTPELLQNYEQAFWLQGLATDGMECVHCKIRPGDALALNPWILHRSMPNTSTRARISIDFRFFGENGSSRKHYLDLQSWRVVAPAES